MFGRPIDKLSSWGKYYQGWLPKERFGEAKNDFLRYLEEQKFNFRKTSSPDSKLRYALDEIDLYFLILVMADNTQRDYCERCIDALVRLGPSKLFILTEYSTERYGINEQFFTEDHVFNEDAIPKIWTTENVGGRGYFKWNVYELSNIYYWSLRHGWRDIAIKIKSFLLSYEKIVVNIEMFSDSFVPEMIKIVEAFHCLFIEDYDRLFLYNDNKTLVKLFKAMTIDRMGGCYLENGIKRFDGSLCCEWFPIKPEFIKRWMSCSEEKGGRVSHYCADILMKAEWESITSGHMFSDCDYYFWYDPYNNPHCSDTCDFDLHVDAETCDCNKNLIRPCPVNKDVFYENRFYDQQYDPEEVFAETELINWLEETYGADVLEALYLNMNSFYWMIIEDSDEIDHVHPSFPKAVRYLNNHDLSNEIYEMSEELNESDDDSETDSIVKYDTNLLLSREVCLNELNYREHWKPEIHRHFPKDVRREIVAFYEIVQLVDRFWLPAEMFFIIAEFISWDRSFVYLMKTEEIKCLSKEVSKSGYFCRCTELSKFLSFSIDSKITLKEEVLSDQDSNG